MKSTSLLSGLVTLAALSSSAFAVTPIITATTVGTETSGSTMPGSPSDYIFFHPGNYPSTGKTNAADSYTNLPDFTAVGGERTNYAPAIGGNSTISTPGGSNPLLTGQIDSPNTIAIGLEEGSSTTFNYNDFNVYVMFNNVATPTDGLTWADSTISLDGRFDGVEQAVASFTVTPLMTSLTTADFVEFNVQGLGAALAYADANDLTSSTDLVLRVTGPSGDTHDLGGVSFVSVIPEPSTWAMMLVGAGGFFFLVRRAKSLV